MLNFVQENTKDFQDEYGRIRSASIGAIMRALAALETEGGDVLFSEPALNIHEWIGVGMGGKGMISILDSENLINNGRLYSIFLLWMCSELLEIMPKEANMQKGTNSPPVWGRCQKSQEKCGMEAGLYDVPDGNGS